MAESDGSFNFSEFTYSKKNHFKLFGNLDLELFKERQNPLDCDLKVYQDLLVLTFIKEHIPPASRILEVGGGDSRIINHIKRRYECWNLDKLEGIGHGPSRIKVKGFRLVKDYIGNFSRALSDAYFDFVFSISVLEHVSQDDCEAFKNIIDDIDRVLRPGGLSLHCVDALADRERAWVNPLVNFIFDRRETLNSFIDLATIMADPELYVMSEPAYHRIWEPITNKAYDELGKPFSYNVLWKKPSSLGKLNQGPAQC
jgi:ubiquinone/menaquinone biosynthesis C-methylase UbiE